MVLARAASQQPGGLSLFVDLHAHATKRGVFIYGNHLEDEAAQVENKLYALLLAVNSAYFDYQEVRHQQKIKSEQRELEE